MDEQYHTYTHTFNYKDCSFNYRMGGCLGNVFMRCEFDNNIIFNRLVGDMVVFDRYRLYNNHMRQFHYHMASTIVGYRIQHGVWPATKTIEDCIKICTELDKIIAMSDSDRKTHMLNLYYEWESMNVLTEFF